ncbi:pentatricopeptide repeat (PPR) superfamily protein [Actinidia rufa]|uniref:Pentatricopeptide repeat (PPR) superfamily protein n=1 Tax=Actinidia rufa TaxID=165716 RepID=A0A7J0FH26_9ERIC|nr:pentatricopeptide repeat (PPR) superfamily protein [Actinidia rufa]
MQHLFRLNEFQRASEIYHEKLEKGIELHSVAATAIVAGHIRQNRVSEAWEVLKSMEEKVIRATRKSYVVFIKELCKVLQADEIVMILNKMKASNIIVGDDMFHWVRSYLEKKGDMENLVEVKQIQRVSKLSLPNMDIGVRYGKPWRNALSSSPLNLFCRFCTNGGWRAKDFKHITSDTWTIMIMQYSRAGLIEIALNNFRELKASGCKPNGSTYKYLIISPCGRKGRKIDEPITTFQEMILWKFVPDKELVEIYLECLCEAGKLSDVRKCANSQSWFHCFTFLFLVCYIALCRAGRLEEASALVDAVGSKQHTHVQHTYGSIIHGPLRRERLEEALAKMESMKELGISLVHFFKEKQIRKALEMFEKMKEEGCEPTIVTCSALIRGYMNSGQFIDVWNVFHQIRGYMNSGQFIDAWNVFHQIKLNGPFPDFKTYSMFITSLCRVGHLKKKSPRHIKSIESFQCLS